MWSLTKLLLFCPVTLSLLGVPTSILGSFLLKRFLHYKLNLEFTTLPRSIVSGWLFVKSVSDRLCFNYIRVLILFPITPTSCHFLVLSLESTPVSSVPCFRSVYQTYSDIYIYSRIYIPKYIYISDIYIPKQWVDSNLHNIHIILPWQLRFVPSLYWTECKKFLTYLPTYFSRPSSISYLQLLSSWNGVWELYMWWVSLKSLRSTV